MANDDRTAEQRIRLHVYLARCGVASRRRCEELIAEQRVAVNGLVISRPGTLVSSSDSVTLDGKKLRPDREMLYIALNKPPRYICSSDDPEGRPKALSLLGGIAVQHHVFSVGRLDFMSSGLILFTNDGAFAQTVGHPSAGIEKEYVVVSREALSDDVLPALTRGITRDGVRYSVLRARRTAANRLTVVLQEGKNREIRNLFAALRISIKSIHRVRVGTIAIGSLPSGSFRFLTKREVSEILSAARRRGADHDTRGVEHRGAKKSRRTGPSDATRNRPTSYPARKSRTDRRPGSRRD